MSNTLITATTLRDYYAIDSTIKDGRLTPAIVAASSRLKSWVGGDAYTDASAEAPEDATRAEVLKAAEAALVMHFAILGLNTKITSGGVVQTVKEKGSVANDVITTYLRPDQTQQLAEMYLNQAEEIARSYALSDGTPAAQVAIVE